MTPLISVISLDIEKPSSSDKRSDRERFLDALITKIGDSRSVDVSLNILRKLPRALRKNNFSVDVLICFMKDRIKVTGLNRKRILGIALDIGTTNIVASLLDLVEKVKLDSIELENPQTVVGPDVLTRVHTAMGGVSRRLHGLLVSGVNRIIKELCIRNGSDVGDVFAVVAAGNTIMTHFLLDLPVENIPVEPYIPAAQYVGFISPDDIGLEINIDGVLYVFPNAGSYVGGDIISGILSSGLHKGKSPSILMDVGTNAEIVLGCDEWLAAGAGAAGPALESGISEVGMTAGEGAVSRVDFEEGTRKIRLSTIGNSEPLGICGSGMIELISELFRVGAIDSLGRFNDTYSVFGDRVVMADGRKSFLVYESANRRIVVTDIDIENFLRSKAAMFTSIHIMVKSVGLCFRDIDRVFVGGAFGSGLNTDKAKLIGLIPAIKNDKFFAVGNSSLKGAERLLLDGNSLDEINTICGMITYHEMNTDGEFMSEFPGALFIPHTDPEMLKG